MKFDSRQILRNYAHDIVVKLKDGDLITLVDFCDELSKRFGVNIHPLYFKDILDRWYDKKYTGVFSPYDSRWLFYDKKKVLIGNSIQKRDPRLGKSRGRMIEEEKLRNLKNSKKKNKVKINLGDIPSNVSVTNVVGRYDIAPVFALTSKVIKSTFVDITDEQMAQIANKVLTNNSIEKSYKGYWDAMTIYGERMGLKYMSDYMKYSPDNFNRELS